MEASIDRRNDAVTRVVETYSDDLLRLALHHTAELATAEDIVQTAFVRYMTVKTPFQNAMHERAWLIRTTINLCHDYHRSAWNRKRTDFDDQLIADEGQPEGALVDGTVLEAVRELPEKERNAIYLYYYLGLSVKEIGRITEEKEGTVTSRLYRARERLKFMLKGAV